MHRSFWLTPFCIARGRKKFQLTLKVNIYFSNVGSPLNLFVFFLQSFRHFIPLDLNEDLVLQDDKELHQDKEENVVVGLDQNV